MSDKVEQWLKQIGLVKYLDLFRENDIEWDILPHLDAETLKEIGVTSAGHRIRILNAARAIQPQAAEAKTGRTEQREEAERRQVTVMFSDLVGSTELSQLLDPEDLREVMRAYQDACKGGIEKFEGFVARYMGDGVLSYFGYPKAQEDAAERAVLSGLAIIDAVKELDASLGRKNDIELKVRIGIATGPVVAGDIIGEGASLEQSVVGETPNLAARLQALATPGTVAIADETQALVSSRIESVDLGVHSLKGIARPVRAWRAVAPVNAQARFDARADNLLTDFHGRDGEIDALLRCWRLARSGNGQVVLISGEPGIGKSRTVETFRTRISTDGRANVRLQCSPHHVNSALYPVIDQLRAAAGFEAGDSPAERFGKLKRLLAQHDHLGEQQIGVLASLLSIPAFDGFASPELAPPVLKAQTFEALFERLKPTARQKPLIVELEDAHWIDPTTLEFMTQVVECVRDMPAIVIVTHRPQFECPWSDQSHVTPILLDHLTSDESRAMIRELCDDREMPPSVLDQILAKTDGVPLFVEELTKNLLESGLLIEKDGRLELAREASSLEIPASLQDSLMARLDRLGPVKRLAQVGAAIGREFSRELIAAAAELEGHALDQALGELVESELVVQIGDTQSSSYQFKHALIQDAAYASLLRSRRQSLHVHIAEVYTRRFPEIVESNPEVPARHWTEGGRPEKAVHYWLEAGKQASRRFSNQEALSHLSSGLTMVEKLPEGESRDEIELKLRVALGTVLRVSAGPGAEVTQDNYDKAVKLCDRLPESADQFAAMWGKWVNAMNFKLELGLQWTDRLERLASELRDDGFILQAHHAQWTTLFHVGRFAEAFSHIEQGLGFYDDERHRDHASLYGGHDPRVCGRAFAAHALWMLGSLDRSLEFARECASWGKELDHVGSMLHVIEAHLLLYQFRNEPEALEPWLDQLDVICKENDLPEYQGKSSFNRGWLIATRGDTERGIELMAQGLENQRGVGSYEDVPMFSERLATFLGASGRANEALEMIDQALAIAEDFSLRYWLAEVHRRKGSLLALTGQRDAATESFRRALEIARQQGARLLELRAATSLAHHATGQETAEAELSELGRLLDSFPDDSNGTDLLKARALYAAQTSLR